MMEMLKMLLMMLSVEKRMAVEIVVAMKKRPNLVKNKRPGQIALKQETVKNRVKEAINFSHKLSTKCCNVVSLSSDMHHPLVVASQPFSWCG